MIGNLVEHCVMLDCAQVFAWCNLSEWVSCVLAPAPTPITLYHCISCNESTSEVDLGLYVLYEKG